MVEYDWSHPDHAEMYAAGDEQDEMGIKGYAAVRSDVADVTVEAQEFVMEQLLYEDHEAAKANIYEKLREMHESITEGLRPLTELGTRGGIGQPLEEYGTPQRTPQPIYRGSKFASAYIDGENISNGDKPMVYPISRILDDELPYTYSAETAEDGDPVDAIAVENPSNLEGLVEIDYEEIWQKQVADRVKPILTHVEMSMESALSQTEQDGLADYM